MTVRDESTGEQFIKVVGRRTPPPPGLPSSERRRALDTLQPAFTGVPKGVFRYASHEAANADRDARTADAMAARAAAIDCARR